MKIFLSAVILFVCCSLTGQQVKRKVTVIIRTEHGNIYAKLNLKRAPLTAQNFLRYVDADLFNEASFYRVVRLDNQPDNIVKIEVIQGGRYKNEAGGFEPVKHETTAQTGIRHRNGTVSMARSNPGSATSEFFICVGSQPALDFGGKRNSDGQGFAAFGKVVRGMKVVKKIHSVNADGQYLQKPVKINGISRKGRRDD